MSISVQSAGAVHMLLQPAANGNHLAFGLDNKASECDLAVGKKLLLKAFISKSGVRNFLNLPYASIPARFKTARLLCLEDLEGVIDARYYGPRCPQGPDELHKIMAHMVERLGMEQRESEYDCLHVNVYSPASTVASSKLPVFVYIHGGALAFGAFGDNTTEFDGNHLVKRSVDLGKPIIVVTLNYRVGVLGFLTSVELQKECKTDGQPHVRNKGLHDQRLALQWVQDNIHYFGGDSSQVTLAGESAGSMSVWAHVKGRHPKLFKRAMMLSGPPFGMQNPQDVQVNFDRIVSRYCNADAPWQAKLACLRSVPVSELALSWEGAISNFIVDPEWFDMTSEQMGRILNGTHEDMYEYFSDLPDWLDSALIMNARDETALFGVRCWKDIDITTARSKLRQAYDVPELCEVLEKSALFTQAKTPFNALTNIGSDAMFIRGSVRLASLAAKKTQKFVYFGFLDAKDPLPFELQGFAWHCMLPSVLFYLPPSQVNMELRETADIVTDRVVRFISGLQPWPAVNEAQQALSIDGKSTRMIPFNRSDALSFPSEDMEEQFLARKLALVGLALREQQ